MGNFFFFFEIPHHTEIIRAPVVKLYRSIMKHFFYNVWCYTKKLLYAINLFVIFRTSKFGFYFMYLCNIFMLAIMQMHKLQYTISTDYL